MIVIMSAELQDANHKRADGTIRREDVVSGLG
jgi:hypothetical protein